MKIKRAIDERWKSIIGFLDYQISDYGRIYSIKSDIILKERDVKGYKCVILWNDGVSKKFYLHVLTGKYFVKGYKIGLEINHKDGCKDNNHYSNLEWVTKSYNSKHAIDNGLKIMLSGEKHGQSKLKEKDVIRIRKCLSNNIEGKTLANEYGVSPAIITRIKQNKIWVGL